MLVKFPVVRYVYNALPKYTHILRVQVFCNSLWVFLKVYYALPVIALTTKGPWELTHIWEAQGISVDYEKRLLQTFPEKVSSLYSTV